MWRILLLLALSLGGTACLEKGSQLSSQELALVQKLEFDEKLIADLKQELDVSFFQYESSDPGYSYEDGELERTGVIPVLGISFEYEEEHVPALLEQKRGIFHAKGYLIFESESTSLGYPSTVTILKSVDQFDILRIEKPDGINYDILPEDVFQRLEAWDQKYGIEIYGADYSWVNLRIKSPIDIEQLALEIFEFCPDIIGHSEENVGEIEHYLSEGLILSFWWD